MAWVLIIESPKRWMQLWCSPGSETEQTELCLKGSSQSDSLGSIPCSELRKVVRVIFRNCTFMWKAWSRPVSTGTIPSWHWPRVARRSTKSSPLLLRLPLIVHMILRNWPMHRTQMLFKNGTICTLLVSYQILAQNTCMSSQSYQMNSSKDCW